jgi:hypothetical protein
MGRMKRLPTRNCYYRHCQRHDEETVRVEVNHPTTGDLVEFTLHFCPAHAPEVWDLQGIRELLIDDLAA